MMPQYPPVARRMEQQGTTLLGFLVDQTGTVTQGIVKVSSGFDRLDQAALSALSTCHFTPAQLDGHPDPTPAWAEMRYTWKLDEPKQIPQSPMP